MRIRLLAFILLLFPVLGYAADPVPPLAAPAAEIKPYPRDVIIAYLTPCINDHKQMVEPCKCMIKQFQARIPLEEFAAMIKLPDPTQDSRFINIANLCLPKQQ